MGIQIIGNSGVVAEVDARRSLKVSSQPLDVGALGSYAAAVSTGAMAAGLAAAAPIFAFRWTDATGKLALIRAVRLAMNSLGTAFTAGVGLFEMFAARGYTASDTGGTAA